MPWGLENMSDTNQNTTRGISNEACYLPLSHGIPIMIINFTLVFVGTFGNFLIIFAVLNTHKLRYRISNFLILSLAVADLIVTMCAQPLQATSVTFKTFRHYCVLEIDFAYDIAGNFSVFCSLFHLAAISIDRALVVTKPHQHQALMRKHGLKTMLFICWGIAFVFVCIRVPFPSTLSLSIALIIISYIIIVLSYAVILYQISRDKVKSNDPAAAMSSTSKDAIMEKRIAGTIAIVIFFFSLCWFPLLGFYVSVGKGVLRELGGVTYMWIRTVVLSNSSMNFIVYSFRIVHFRVAYLRTINKILKRPREIFGGSKFATSGAVSQESKDNYIKEMPSRLEVSRDYSNATSHAQTTRMTNPSLENDREVDGACVMELDSSVSNSGRI
ncbi:galanin receptor type 2-like [Actinia tenebrosa]|uniref:Galanin receptor type 2-like n=1 Tax=Actinia tenebrosa TaxID=6105 RepID=A0A6P8I995_ACTTE|nr:galanin receptor type 2-like [Actinia tenebrosa]